MIPFLFPHKSNLGLFLALSCLFVLLCSLFSCTTTGKISNQNLSYIYQRGEDNRTSAFSVFKFKADSAKLFIRLNPSQFLSSKQADGRFFARVAVRMQLFESYDALEYKTIVDSAVFKMPQFFDTDSLRDYVDFIKFKCPDTDEYLIKIILIDQNKSNSAFYYLQLNHNLDKQNSSSFQMLEPHTGQAFFKNYLTSDESFSLLYRDTSIHKFLVNYYNRSFPLAEPPFSVKSNFSFDFTPDSFFYFYAGTLKNLPNTGFYHFRIDTAGKQGFTIFSFQNQFPKISLAKELIEPLRYITAKKEYDELILATDKKRAVDSFWLSIAGDPERAKHLIRKFYTRVQESNNLFTSYLQGWKSDRGMIYIVFGPPNAVYKTSNAETWIFGDPSKLQSIVFTFVKVINPFTDNDYQLSRSIIYQSAWYLAVEAWRDGRIFNDN